jgi:hypothetical protein
MNITKNIYQTHIIQRSNIMKSSLSKTFAGRSLYALLISALVTITAFGQNLAITGAPTLNGTGTYNVKGNITNTVATNFTGTVAVTMNGAAAQSIGTIGNGAINFQTLNIMPTVGATTTLNVASTVSTAVTIGTGAIATTLAIGTNNLTITGTSAFGNGTSALTTAAGSTVTFNSGVAGQVVLGGFTYNGNLTLSGGATKTLSAATVTTVGQAFDASAAGLLTVSNGGLTLGTTGSFAAATISSGNLTGGSGLATFNGLLTKTGTGNLISGSGNLSLLAGLTNTAGNITLAGVQSMAISGGQFAYTAGTLTFPATSTVTYGGSATNIVPSTYGNLTLNTDTKTFPAGTTNVATLLTANSSMIITGTLAMSTAAANANIAGDFTDNGIFTAASGAGVVTFNGAAQAIAGTATPTFRNLTLGGTLTKTANTSINISTGGQLAVNRPLVMSGANVLTMQNGALQPSFTGQIEITGSMAWQAYLAQAYTYNNSATNVTFTTADGARTFTLKSAPDTYPTGNNPGNTVKRSLTASYAGWATGTLAMQLGYLQAEGSTLGVTETKLKDFQNGNISVANKVPGSPSGRVTSGAGTFGSVTYTGLTNAQLLPAANNALALDDRFNSFISIANNNWNNSLTWSLTDPSLPSINDDVNIIGTHNVTIPDGITASALSVTIDGTTANTLTVGAGASGILNVGVGGLTNNATLGVLTVSTNAIVNITGGSLATGGSITNNGVINVQ